MVNASGTEFRRISLQDIKRFSEQNELAVASASIVEDNSIGNIGLTSDNFFSFLGVFDENGSTPRLTGPRSIVINGKQNRLREKPLAVGDSVRLQNNMDYTVSSIVSAEFNGLSFEGEFGWVSAEGNHSLFTMYESVPSYQREKFFRLAPVYIGIIESRNHPVDFVGHTPLNLYDISSTKSIKFNLEGFRATPLKGLSYDFKSLKTLSKLALWSAMFVLLLFVFLLVAISVLVKMLTNKNASKLSLHEKLGAPITTVFLMLGKLTILPVLIAVFVSGILLWVLLSSSATPLQPIIQLMELDGLIVVFSVIAFLYVAVVSLVSYVSFSYSKEESLGLRHTESKSSLRVRSVLLYVQVFIVSVSICLIPYFSEVVENYTREEFGFASGGYSYLSVDRRSNSAPVNTFSHLKNSIDSHSSTAKIYSLVGALGFGQPWETHLSTLGGKAKPRANIHFLSPDFFKTAQFGLMFGSTFTSSVDRGVVLNSVAAERLSSQPSSLVGRTVYLDTYGVRLPKAVLGIIDDGKTNSATVYYNMEDDENIKVSSDEFLFYGASSKKLVQELNQTLSPLGYYVSEFVDLDTKLISFRKEFTFIKNGFSVFLVCVVTLFIFTMIVNISYTVARRRRELKLKMILGAKITSLLVEAAKSYLYTYMLIFALSTFIFLGCAQFFGIQILGHTLSSHISAAIYAFWVNALFSVFTLGYIYFELSKLVLQEGALNDP
ncbi:hypothetical protein [uncultured Pseudoteredinibacter sp.]|uniref:hypothetical protein n=1 Tax=uncultured Pseudoteredinibacter sp. TaxID=1641701 RepID=UPI00261C79A6|nr:hypothetical protein [uncultured Pseudoteredinibacter sp.]